VIYLGVSNDGSVEGLKGLDSMQRTIRLAAEDCYPAISFQSETLEVEGKTILAIEVPYSTNRPHFAGPAFVRRGAENVKASDEIFNELITSRLEKPREILKWRDHPVTVVARRKRLGSTQYIGDNRYEERHDCRIEACTAHYVRMQIVSSGAYVTEPLENISISFDEKRHRVMLIVEEKRN
jgi:hypothetical protein